METIRRKEYLCGEKVYTETEKIKEISIIEDGYDIRTEKDKCFILQTKQAGGTRPQIGDNVTLHTIQGTRVVGMDINGKALYFLKEEELYTPDIFY